MDEDRERRRRSVALGLVLGGLAILFFVMSIVQWSEHVHH
jgi:hypothetical protein